jgi:hypothetical protein
MHINLSGRADELASLTDLIRASLPLADSTIPAINRQITELAEMGIDNIEIEGPLIFSRAAGTSLGCDDRRVLFAAALVTPDGVGIVSWDADEYEIRYGDSNCEPPHLRPRFTPYDRCPPIIRAMLPAHAPRLIVQLLQSFSVLPR